jgi:hypothetical protein
MMRIALPRLPLAVWRRAERLPTVGWAHPWLVFATAAEVPRGEDWLAAAERSQLDTLPTSARPDWRTGRWVAKQVLADHLRLRGHDLHRLALLPDGEDGLEPHLDGSWLDLALALSQSAGAAAAVAVRPPLRVGCDLERLEPRRTVPPPGSLSAGELAAWAATPPATQALLTSLSASAKRSARALLRGGPAVDPRHLEVRLQPSVVRRAAGNWQPLEVTWQPDGEVFAGFWTRLDAWVLTLVAHGP